MAAKAGMPVDMEIKKVLFLELQQNECIKADKYRRSIIFLSTSMTFIK